jgi:uncharacterized membrane protein (DUF2068 family)
VHVDAEGRVAGRIVAKLFSFDHKQLEELTLATFAYAAVFVVEGVGLFLRKRWAEYLTLAVTVSFLPFEIVELVREPTVPKWLTLALNVAVVVYLAVRTVARVRHR